MQRFLGTLVVLQLLCRPIQGTIHVESTGQSYQSWPDRSLGPQLAEHQLYKARLQQLRGNSHLCFPPSDGVSWNVTVPDDGSPGEESLGEWNTRF
jgi:hypothetical protein